MKPTTEDAEHTEVKRDLFGSGVMPRNRRASSPIPYAPCFPWFLLLFLSAVASAAEFRVGFAQAELISTGVNDPLRTKAMVVQEGNYEPTACPLEPGCGELLVAAAVKLLNELKP